MKTKYFKKIAASILALALIVLGAWYFEADANEVFAADEDFTYAGSIVAGYKTSETYPTKDGMVFAGWYTDSAYTEALTGTPKTSDTYYAKFVPVEVLSVKFQFSTDGNKLRFISSVDNLNYLSVGFELTVTDGESVKEYVNSNTEVFKRINAEDATNTYKYSSKVIDTASEYMITATWSGVTDTASYMVKPYWVTLDGTTVYGISRTVSFADYGKVNVAIEVEEEIAVGTDLKAAYGTENEATATVIGYDAPYAHVKINLGAAGLSSATTFTVSKTNGAELGTVVYRNLGTKYTGSGTEDTSWYTEYAGESEFVIATVADLYGLATVVNDGRFTTETVYMCADMNVNPTFDANATAVTTPDNTWTPIGNSATVVFQGTFDGQGHTIEGIYLSTDSADGGLFGNTATSSYVRDFSLKNSFFSLYSDSSNADLKCIGSIAGHGLGTFEKIYSNARIESNRMQVGGLIGRTQSSGVTHKISNCWFDGSIESTNSYVGGIVGANVLGTIEISNCLNTGTIKAYAYVGGILGSITNRNITGNKVENCLGAGKITVTANAYAGSVFGGNNKSGTEVSLAGSYGTRECYDVCEGGANTMTLADAYATEVNKSDVLRDGETSMSLLDFTEHWTLRAGKVPTLQIFAAEEDLISTDWYNPDETTHEINTVADLYGLLKLSTTVNFFEHTIKLGNDIIVNEGNPETNDWATTAPEREWASIGTTSRWFNGSFDGNGHTIKGIYQNDSTQYTGLFGLITINCTVSNLRLVDSYFESTYEYDAYIGSIAGRSQGQLENVYSNAIVVCAGNNCGGLVGIVNGSGEYTFNNCWFDGEIKTAGQNAGGIVGYLEKSTLNISNCLNTGKIDGTYTGENYIGGFCGRLGTSIAYLNISECLAAGKITTTNTSPTNCVGSVVGDVTYDTINSNVKIESVFATKESSAMTLGTTYNNTTGMVIRTFEGDRLVGYCTEETKNADGTTEGLYFTNNWVMRENGMPVPACFKDLVSDEIADPESLAKEIGLDYWGMTLKQAVNYGVGNYVLGINSTQTQYEAYLKLLDKDSEQENLGFTKYVDNSAATTLVNDGVLNAIYTKEDWVLNVTYVGNSIGKTYITISTEGEESLSPNLFKPENVSTNGTVSLSMLEVGDRSGNGRIGYDDWSESFVIQLKNGHFIIIDGSYNGALEELIAYLKTMTGGATPVVDAWIATHMHTDHTAILMQFVDYPELIDDILVEAFYIDEPNNAAKIIDASSTWYQIEKEIGATQMLKTTQNTAPKVYRYQMGQRYYFDDITMDVIQSLEQIPTADYPTVNDTVGQALKDFNTTSITSLFTLNDGTKILSGGDANDANMEYIMDAYGANPQTLADIEVFIALHHGKNTLKEYGEYLIENASNADENHKFDVVLFPSRGVFSGNEYFTNAAVGNIYLLNNCEQYFSYAYYDEANDVWYGTVVLTFDETTHTIGAQRLETLLDTTTFNDSYIFNY